MAKYRVLLPYKDLKIGRVLAQGEVVDMPVKRAEEIEKKLSDDGFSGQFLEREKDTPKEAKDAPEDTTEDAENGTE